MCGRFAGFSTIEEIERHFGVQQLRTDEVQPSYNVAPTHRIVVIINEDGKRVLELMKWGLVPHWADDPAIGYKLINARTESVAEKPSFKAAFQKRRCLIVNDGFFEWTGPKGNRKPLFIRPSGQNGPFAFAGLWEVWKPKDKPDALPMRSCTILTMDAAESIRRIQHRMPVMLKPEAYGVWLNSAGIDPGDFKQMISNQTYSDFEVTPVSPAANRPDNNDPSLLDPLFKKT